VVYWFYADSSNYGKTYSEYYQTYYSTTEAEADAVKPFSFARAYFPSDTLKDLAIEASGFDYATQQNFRSAVEIFTTALGAAVGASVDGTFKFEDFSIVINHYENLGNKGIAIEGLVGQGELQKNFKGFLDLSTPSASSVFVPENYEPTEAELSQLKALNQKVVDLGGDPTVANLEPEK
jgi:hypothetical protein